MNSKISALLVVFLFLASYTNAQEKSKKEVKEEKKLALQMTHSRYDR